MLVFVYLCTNDINGEVFWPDGRAKICTFNLNMCNVSVIHNVGT